MITLAAGGTLQAVAGTNSAITCTVTGLESSVVNGEVFKVLGQAILTTSVVAQYTAPSSPATTAFIKEVLLSNTTAAPVTGVKFFVNGTGVGNQIVTLVIPANGTAVFDAAGWKVYDSSGFAQTAGATGPTGARGATYKGTYSGATAYAIDDVVTDNGSTWINISASTGVAPPTLPTTSNAKWSLVAAKGDTGSTGPQGPTAGPNTIDNTMLTDMAQATFKMRAAAAGTGDPIDGTAAQAKTALAIANTDVSGLGTLATVSNLTGNVTSVGAATTIPAGTVTNAMQSNMAAGTLSGNNTGSPSAPIDLTVAQATAMLNAATTALQGVMSAADKTKLNGAWKDIVADFGADPTGTVDCTALIQTAVDSFSSNGGRLYFPAGSYKVDLSVAATITISKPVIIYGAGRSISNILTTHATKTVFTMAAGAQGAGFEQIRISGSVAGTRTAGHMVDFGNLANVYMQQCDIIYCWSGVHSGGALQFLDDMNIREVSQNNASGQAVLIDSSGDRYIRRLTTDSGASVATAAGIRIKECSSCVVSDSNIIHAGTCVELSPNAGAGHQVASVWIMQSFLDTSHVGFSAVPATNNDSINRVRLIGCWLSTMTTAGAILGSASINVANANSISFIGCEIYQDPVGIDSLGIAEWDIRASRVAGCTTAGIRVAQGAQAGVQSFTISDNYIGSGAGFAVNAIGITIGAGTYGRYQILDNRGLDNNTTPGIADSGSTTYIHQKNVTNNMGAGLLVGSQNVKVAQSFASASELALHSVKVQANVLKVGTAFRVYGAGLVTNTTAASTSIIRVRIGPTTLTGALVASWSVVMGITARTNNPFFLEMVFGMVTGTTAIGQVLVTGTFSTALAAATTAVTTPIAINPAVDNFVEVTITSGAATTTWNFHASTLEVLQP